jgi:adenylosuccinate lyase
VIPRYSLPEMAEVFSDRRRLEVWTEVEILALRAWADLGVVPREAVAAVEAAPVPTPTQVAERERVTNHDLAAFVDVLAAAAGPGGEWVHYGLTSSDVLDTATGVILSQACDLLIDRARRLFQILKAMAFRHRDTVMLGRTHGMWAEPTTFGLKLAGWAFETARGVERLRTARDRVAVGKVSGAVGTYAHVPPEVEAYVCQRLGLTPESASTQVVPRDRHAELLQTLALVGASLERFATEIRLLQRPEVGEVREPFGSGQKGSSAMPHKRNPILSERITGLARLLRGYGLTGLENVALWHERDISHSSVERVTLPDACQVLHYMLVRFADLMEGLEVDSDRMRANLDSTRGLVASQAVLLTLVSEQGLDRDTAYRIVQEGSLQVAAGEASHLLDVLIADPRVTLDRETLEACFLPERFLGHIGVVFDRLEAVTV